jgi:tRNA A37 threonylcarbamoyladenosine dehydratase
MIKKFFQIISYIVLFILLLVAFLPKENLYYFALEELKKYDLLVKNETIKDGYYDFAINDADFVLKGIDAVGVKSIHISTMFVSSKVDITNVSVDQSLRQFVPSKLETLSIKHVITNPLIIDITLSAKEIKGYGIFNILEKKLVVFLSPSKKFVRDYKKLLRKAKKQSNGEYKIEYQL